MREREIAAGIFALGEYAPSDEAEGVSRCFTAERVATAFDVATDRVHRAMAGEFGLRPEDQIESRQAQHLAEVILGDQSQAEREAALMTLGAFTPRPDHQWGIGQASPDEESDKVKDTANSAQVP